MTIHRPAPTRAASTIALSVLVLAQLAACGPAAPSVVPPASSAGVAATPAASASPVPSATPTPSAEPSITADAAVETVVDGLVAPVGLVAPPDDTGRLFVLEQTGLISVLQPGAATVTPFLDLRDRVVELRPDYDERGLLGLAFHPDFATNGRFFVYYGAAPRKGAAAGSDHTEHAERIPSRRGPPRSSGPDLGADRPPVRPAPVQP